jgi:hypothetical protein
MLTLKARYFVDLGVVFRELGDAYFLAEEEKRPLAAPERGDVQAHLENVYRLCTELKLSTARALVRDRLDHDTLPKTLEAWEMLRDTVYAELKDKWFAYIPSDRLDYFDTDQIVSFEVRQAFPRATAEVRNAGTCYAMGLPTACVFHAMRAVEIGVQIIGIKLGVTFDYPIELAEWGKIVGELEPKIQAFKIGARSTQKDENLRFYSQAAAQFRHFNNGWRIRASHARAVYEDAQAKTALDHVRTFFETLAERLSEPE